MVEIHQFVIAVIVISASGVMAPGPLFVATLGLGIREGARSGFKVAIGHTVVEFPLVMLIGLGVLSLDVFPQSRALISILGAASIFAFAALQIRATLKGTSINNKQRYGSFLTGVMLTGLNPFFLVWWFTIGFKMISDAYLLWSFWGLLVMFGLHIWMDYAWLTTVSMLSSKGAKFLSSNTYKIAMLGINGAMIYFGMLFVGDFLSAINSL
jgi:threonine/homoserine/homoserine lactone efflux protein